MKRIGNLYEKVYDMENLKLAHHNARKGKLHYSEVKMIDANPEKYLTLLQQSLINKTYDTSPYRKFIKVDKNKEREIYKLPYFPDRICQWAIIQVIEPYLIRTMIDDTYSAIPGRGTHAAYIKLRAAVSTDHENTQYCLKLDVSKYYPHVDHEILMTKYRRMFKDPDLLWIIEEIIESASPGIPIGNYISQYSGNIYLSDFDHWIKEQTDAAYYFRYMDDIVILHKSKEYLHQLKLMIDEYFTTKLKLTMKDNWQVFPVNIRGIDFVGYRVFRDYTLLRKSICKSLKLCTKKIRRRLKSHELMTYRQWASVNSYRGWLVHCDCYRLKQKYITPLEGDIKNYYNVVIRTGGKVNDSIQRYRE